MNHNPSLPARRAPVVTLESAESLPSRFTAQPSASELARTEPAVSLLEIVLRHKGKLIVCLLLAMFAGLIYQLTAPRIYEATSEIFVQKSRGGEPISPLSPGGLSAGEPATHAALLGSTPVLLDALGRPGVSESDTFAGFEHETQKLRHLQQTLSIESSEKSEIVRVSFRSEHREDTARIVNAVVAAYLQKQQLRAGPSPTSVAPRAAGASPDPSARPGVMEDQMVASRLMKLAQELTAAELSLEEATLSLEKAQEAALEGDLTEISAQLAAAGLDARNHGLAELAYLRAELARLDQELEGMPDSWGPSHKLRQPVERQADMLAKETQTLRRSVVQTMVGLLTSMRHTAAERVAELQTRVAAEQSHAAAMAQLPVDVFQPADVPTKKVAPRGVKTMGLAMFLGLATGTMWVLRSEIKAGPASDDAALRQAAGVAAEPAMVEVLCCDDIAQSLPQDESPLLLGQVPEVPAGDRLTAPRFDGTASSIHQIRAVLQVQARQQQTAAYAFTSPRRGAGKTSVAIGVASSLAMSGTRTLVVDCDLAGRIARGQTRGPAAGTGSSAGDATGAAPPDPAADSVFRDPAHQDQEADQGFGPLDPEGSSGENPCLDNIVIEQGYISEDDSANLSSNHAGKFGIAGMLDGGSLEDCAVKATVPGLALLPAVDAQTRHIGQMSDAFIRRLIDEARADYDLILFDTGPVPGSVEALLVTSQVDGVVVVVPQGEERKALARTMSYLKVVGATVTGTVFNRASNTPKPGPAGPDRSGPGATATATATATVATATATESTMDHAGENTLVELEREQAAPDDAEFLEGDAPLGSGILAAAVFSDADSAYASDDWKLEETSEFNGSIDELFGKVDPSEADPGSDTPDKADA
ncbi:MAG: hypothetical protein AAGG38_11245 [Planctomycetota bacterium]